MSQGEDHVLRSYLEEVRRTPLLEREEEIRLARLARAGDLEAFQRLVKANLRFVVNVVKRYRRSGVALLDLINEGNVGLIRAARKFDPEKGLRFISYAIWWIRTTISLFLARQGGILSVPAKKLGILYKLEATHSRLSARLSREPTHDELAAAMEVDREELRNMMIAQKGYVALDRYLFAEGGGDGIMAQIVGNDAFAPVERALSVDAFQEEISVLLARLGPRERTVIQLHFGLEGNTALRTFAEIGERLGVSREGARLIFHRAIEKLKQMPEFAELRDYWF